MLLGLRRWRTTSNVLGIFFSLLVLVASAASLPFFFWGSRTIAYSLFFSAVGLNYFITLILSLELIQSHTREDLFVNFCLFIFLIFPAIGIFFYFLLGFDCLHKDHRDIYTPISNRYRAYERGIRHESLDPQSPFFRVFSHNHLRHRTGIYGDTRVEVLDNAYRILRGMTEAIEGAKRHIHMEFYMFSDGLVMDHLVHLLGRKVREGVEVRLIVDCAGNANRLRRRSLRRMRELGIEVRIFNRLMRVNHLWWQFRNHNKVMVVDNECAICGSCNVADEYFNITKQYFQTTELSLILRGEIVAAASAIFLSHWDLCNSGKDPGSPEFDEDRCAEFFRRNGAVKEDGVFSQMLDNTPIGGGFVIRDNLMQLIFGAKRSIVISTPYFYPPKELVNALRLVRSEGIDVRILVPKTPDLTGFFNTLNRQPLEPLVEQGVGVYEYFGFNHEKLMIIDGEVVYMGSYNWDYRALYLNFEHAVLLRCRRLAGRLERFMERQFKNSHRITRADLRRHKHFYLYSVFVRLFKPFL